MTGAGLAPELAATHLAAFGPARAWPAADFTRYAADPLVTIFGDTRCFAVIRMIADEAEILTLATDPAHQGQGLATRMLDQALARLKSRDIATVFLDVAADNAPAIALYSRAGFKIYAERRNYYQGRTTALLMSCTL